MKQLVIKVLTIICLSAVFTSAAFAVTMGDTDGDGSFSLTDVMTVLRAATEESLGEEKFFACDMDKNGELTLGDALKLVKLVLKADEKPSYCAIDNLYHEGCMWETLELGINKYYTYSHSKYPGISIRYKILLPKSYSPHKSYALVTHLHGAGGEKLSTSSLSGSTFFSNIKESEYGDDTIYLLPQCPVGMYWPDHRDTIRATYQLIMYLTKHLSIDESRLYLSGHSNGSKGVAYMLMEYPNTFAAAVMGSGASGLSYYTDLENIATASIWMFIGTADEAPGFYDNVNNLYNALKDLGADVKYTEFEGLKHNIFSTVGNTEGLVDWVFSKTLSK